MVQEPSLDSALPKRLSCRVDDSPRAFRVSMRTGSLAVAGFLLLWLTIWTAGCAAMAWELLNKFELQLLLFATPFWAAEVFVACILLQMLFGREEVALHGQGLDYRATALVTYRRRHIPLEEIREFRPRTDRGSKGRAVARIEVVSGGRPLKFGGGLRAEERQWLTAELNRRLWERQGRDVSTAWPEDAPPEDEQPAPPTRRPPATVEVQPADSPVEPPSDCRWTLTRGFREMEFFRRGKLEPATIGGLLFVCLFWNGIVSVFLFALWSGELKGVGIFQWGAYLFLAPFVAVGMFLLLALAGAVFAPLHTTRWIFDRHEILCRHRWALLGYTWHYPVVQLRGIEIQREAGLRQRHSQMADDSAEQSGNFRVALVNEDNTELCAVGRLYEGEARWMADTILRERPDWFSRR